MPDKPRTTKKGTKPAAKVAENSSKSGAKAAAKPVAKKSSPKNAANKNKTSRAKARPKSSGPSFFVHAPMVPPIVSTIKPSGKTVVHEFATFDEAKAAAIDSLLLAIEELETQLHGLKRAASLEDFSRAGDE